MNEQRPKPVFDMKNELHTKLDHIRWALDEAREAVDTAQTRVAQAMEAMAELMNEDGEVFQRVRCKTCLTSWIDERSTPKVTNCPMCGRGAA